MAKKFPKYRYMCSLLLGNNPVIPLNPVYITDYNAMYAAETYIKKEYSKYCSSVKFNKKMTIEILTERKNNQEVHVFEVIPELNVNPVRGYAINGGKVE